MTEPKGKALSRQRGLRVLQSRYSYNGKWYENPTGFPCAFHDEEGYVIADDPEHWQRLQTEPEDGAPFFKVTKTTNVKGVGIRGMAEYVRHRSTRPPESPQGYAVENIVSDGCFLPESELLSILDRLRAKKNLILQGPPGTGKTWLARKLAFALMGSRSESRVRPFQFHPNLSYEDFVRGWRPDSAGRLALVDGPFLEAAINAREDPSNSYVVVIEEINRGNPAQILGEMLTLMEADKRTPGEALALSYPRNTNERVYIPSNLYIIGTMNVADRSLALVDFALRRRFAFYDLEPTFGERWRSWVSEQCDIDPSFLANVEERLISLNETISGDKTLGPQFRVGHSVVTPSAETNVEDPREWFRQVVETEILPLLGEYWFEDRDRARSEGAKLLQDLVP